MPTPMKAYNKIAKRYGVDPNDEEAVDAFFAKRFRRLPKSDQQQILTELLNYEPPATARAALTRKSAVKRGARGPLSKSALIQALAERHAGHLTSKDIGGLVESIVNIGYQELRKNGVFVVPGLVKMLVVKSPGKKARKGINPFTKEPTLYKARPVRKGIRVRPLRFTKDILS
jgi:DNA-binding protein HU-beta